MTEKIHVQASDVEFFVKIKKLQFVWQVRNSAIRKSWNMKLL